MFVYELGGSGFDSSCNHKKCCSGVSIINFRGVGIEDPNPCTLELFSQFKGEKLKFSINSQMGSKYTSETLDKFYFD